MENENIDTYFIIICILYMRTTSRVSLHLHRLIIIPTTHCSDYYEYMSYTYLLIKNTLIARVQRELEFNIVKTLIRILVHVKRNRLCN